MSQQRIRKIAEEIRKNLSHIIRNQVKDPRIAELISIIKVELSRDMGHAKIYVSILGNDKEKESTMEGLHNASGFIRKELGASLKLRYVPAIQFKLDSSIEHGIAMSGIISALIEKRQEASDDFS